MLPSSQQNRGATAQPLGVSISLNTICPAWEARKQEAGRTGVRKTLHSPWTRIATLESCFPRDPGCAACLAEVLVAASVWGAWAC